MAEELARHVGPESASFVHLVFALHDADELRALAQDAGFDAVDVRSAHIALELPLPEDFLWQYVRSTPLAGAVADVDQEHRAALERDYAARCREFVEDGALKGSVRMTTVTATR